MGQEHNSSSVAVFWSGGWDSTFRILELVVRHGCQVQPIYVIDPNRRSSDHEIAAMDKVRAGISEKFPDRVGLLLETKYFDAETLHVPEPNRSQYLKLRASYQVGWQYYWMSAVGQEMGFEHVEVMVHGNDTAPMWQFLRDNVLLTPLPCGATTYVMTDWDPADEYAEGMELFKKFAYPTINIEKPAMEAIAREHGFYDLMLHTWFCHFPLGDQPCGMCFTCRHVIYDGLSKRFPKSALMRNKVWFIVHPVRVAIMEPDRTVKRIKELAVWTRARIARRN